MLEKENYAGLTIEYQQDSDSESPREWENLGTMACAHRRYQLGDKQSTQEELEELGERKDALSLPLYLYDHSDLTMSTKPFSCPWDSGQVGVIYVTYEKIRKEFDVKRITSEVKEKVIACLEQEVKIYDAFLRGNVYGYVIKSPDGEVLDSTWGFYVSDNADETYLRESARDAADLYAKHLTNEAAKEFSVATQEQLAC